MNPRPSNPVIAVLFAIVTMVALAPLSVCQADCGCRETWCAWKRTWHGQNPLDTPLRPYYIPRTAWTCDCAAHADCGEPSGYCFSEAQVTPEVELALRNGACQRPACAAAPCGGFERLGQIPNDFALGADPAVAAAAAGR